MGNDLARRVRENTGTDIEKAGEKPISLAQQIRNMEDQFRNAMPRGAEAVQLVRDALTCLRTTPKLAECEPQSVLGALMTCAQLGLRPSVPGLGHAWPLPFWDSRLKWIDHNGKERTGGNRAQLIIGYQGYRELAQRSGQIASVIGRIVHANDYLDIDYGVRDDLVHKPCLDGARGEPVGYYAIVKYTNGGYSFWHMSKAEVEEHRDQYAMARKPIWVDGKKTGQTEIVGPWRDQFDEMAIKTAFLRLAKWMPKSTELAAAIEADGTVRVDLTPDTDTMLYGERPQVIDSDEPGELASGTVETVETAKPAGPPATKTMIARLNGLLSDCGVGADERAQTLAELAGRPILGADELVKDEAEKAIAVLDRCAKDAEPSRALDAVLANLDQGAES